MFQVLATVYSGAMKIGVHVSSGIKVFSRNMPRSAVAGSYGNSFFSFLKELPYCSPLWLYQFTCPLIVQEGSLFTTHSPEIIFCRIFDDGYPDWCEVIPHCGSDVHFSNSQVDHLFMCMVTICMSSLEKCLFKSPHFFGLSFIFFSLSLLLILAYKSCFYILETNVLKTNEICNFVQEAVIKNIAQEKKCQKKGKMIL